MRRRVHRDLTGDVNEAAGANGGGIWAAGGVAPGGPIIDRTLGFPASVWFRRDGGWIDRVDPTTGDVVDPNANHQQTLVLRLAGIWKPLDAVTVTPRISYQD